MKEGEGGGREGERGGERGREGKEGGDVISNSSLGEHYSRTL